MTRNLSAPASSGCDHSNADRVGDQRRKAASAQPFADRADMHAQAAPFLAVALFGHSDRTIGEPGENPRLMSCEPDRTLAV